MAHWADNHTQGQSDNPATAPAPQRAPERSPVFGILKVVLILGTMGGGLFWLWQSGLIQRALTPEPTAPISTEVQFEPISSIDPRERARIERGIQNLEKQRNEHQALAEGLQEKMTLATTERLWPAQRPQYTYEQWVTNELNKARSQKSSTHEWEMRLNEYRGKITELTKKTSHELEIVQSLDKRIATERAKLP